MTIAEKLSLMRSSLKDIADAVEEYGVDKPKTTEGLAAAIYDIGNVRVIRESHIASYDYPEGGTVAEKLAFYQNIKAEIRDAIEYQGVTVADDVAFSKYGDKIREIDKKWVAKNRFLASGKAYRAYSQRINMLEGSDNYTFEAVSTPKGLTLSSDGTLSGTPTGNGLYNFKANLTHTASGKLTTGRFSVIIYKREVTACVTINGSVGKDYGGNGHRTLNVTYAPDATYNITVTLADAESGEAVEYTTTTLVIGVTHYTITSGETLEVSGIEAGTLGVTVYDTLNAEVVGNTGVNTLTVNRAPVTVTFENQTFTYGTDYEVAVTLDPVVEYTLYYEGNDGAWTTTKPTEVGVYTMQLQFNNASYGVAGEGSYYTSAKLTIVAAE